MVEGDNAYRLQAREKNRKKDNYPGGTYLRCEAGVKEEKGSVNNLRESVDKSNKLIGSIRRVYRKPNEPKVIKKISMEKAGSKV